MRSINRLCILLSATLLCPTTQFADVLYSQAVGPNGKFTGGGFDISGTNFSFNGQFVGYQSIASSFTLNVDALLTQIDIGLVYVAQSSSHDVLLKLEHDDPVHGIPNGEVIGSATVTATAPAGNDPVDGTPFYPAASPISLVAGETYWIVALPTDPFSANLWTCESLQPNICTFASSHDGTTYMPAYDYSWPSFQVIGTIVPEPGAFQLTIIAAALVSLRLLPSAVRSLLDAQRLRKRRSGD